MEAPNLDRILAKYVTVWVWSILVGINTTLTFSFVSVGIRSRGPIVATVLGPLTVGGIVASIIAWWFIIRFLQIFIIPRFFWLYEEEIEKDPRTFRTVGYIGMFTVVAIVFRLLLAAGDFAFGSI